MNAPGDRRAPAMRMGADLDAYRRLRNEMPDGRESLLMDAIDKLKLSGEPQVMFSRLADVCVPAFCDGCEIEVTDGTEAPVRVLVESEVTLRSDSVSPKAGRADPGVISVPFQVGSRSGQGAYAVLLTLWWHDRAPRADEWNFAQLLVRHVSGLVDRQRLMERSGHSESRTANVAMQAIASRKINLAIGITMSDRGCSVEDAEELLRQSAAKRRSNLFDVAAELVRTRHLRLTSPTDQ